jgi:1,4-dihydroxy-2-naphthoyl-CoA hydrolase
LFQVSRIAQRALGATRARDADNRYRAAMTAPASPFRRDTSLEALNAMSRGTAMEPLGIVFTEVGADFLRATMPVDARTRQPYGLLHGGASVLLAETLGSSAGMLSVGEGQGVVGIEVNANHLRGVREGTVTGTARPLHVGRSTQVWEIRIEDEAGRAVCVSRLTLAVIALPER